MEHLRNIMSIRKFSTILLVALLGAVYNPVFAQAVDKVTVHQDGKGWKLKVNGEDFFVKGMVWGYSPRNENYTYNLWEKSDEFIKKVLDYDFGLMSDAGVNAVRSFAMIPPKWVTYVYKEHGIMIAINPLMGRYGSTIGGVWRPNTDYSDPLTRETLKAEVLDVVRRYKDVPGVLMFALGNESNYGLSWKSFEIENLPVGEQNKQKARYLYSLFDEVIDAGKAIAPDHLFTIVNGDIQYIDLIAEYGKDWDLLGVNAYRGITFTDLWENTKAKLGIPVLFFEFGSDAFNARTFEEDQAAQARYLKGQWQDMYNNSYGNGGVGNSIGGFVFEWRDEWWKYRQEENLDKHDTNASWSNGGYQFDFVEGQNNMNEEWFGVMRLGDINSEGIYVAEPRMAYDVLSEIWRIDPYEAGRSAIQQAFNQVDMDTLEVKSEARLLKSAKKEADAFKLSGGSIKLDSLAKGLGGDIDDDGQDGISYGHGLMGFLDFEFQPTRNIRGDFTLNFIASASESDFEFRYGDRINDEDDPGENVELYDFQATYEGESFDLNAFYHVPRYHWGNEGDFFGLLRETTDMEGQDIWNSKAPYGVEFVGKEQWDGLKIVAGPEVYWGANPKAIVKYQFGDDDQYSIMHSEDISRRDESSSATEPTGRRSRQTTLQGEFEPRPGMKLEVGGIISGTNKLDEKFDRVDDNGNIVEDEIEFEDTLGLKAKLSFNAFQGAKAYVGVHYAGLVADGGEVFRERDTQLPYSELGNKQEVEAGLDFSFGSYSISPKLLYRDNIVDANPSITANTSGTTLTPGIEPRNQDDDPFAVLGNRAARSAELYLTYDPTPETNFYAWNNDLRENAKFAFNVGVTATNYTTPTDAHLFFFEEGNTNASFGAGLEEEDVWLLRSKMVFNPRPGLKAVTRFEAGKQQPSGQPEEAIEFAGVEGKFIFNDKHIVSAKFKKDAWGPYDFQRQFNETYPEQFELGYVRLLSNGLSEKDSSKFGVKALYRTLDENSSNEFYQDGENDDMFEVQTFFEYKF